MENMKTKFAKNQNLLIFKSRSAPCMGCHGVSQA